MSNKTIGGASTSTSTPLPVASTIDGTNDYLPIYTANLTATQAINRATLLGVTGQPADISSTQTFTNKVIGITNTITALDSTFTIQDNADATKKAVLQASTITTGNTRTLSLPDVNDRLVARSSTDTLTNKTLTSPTINGGTLDNATVTVDAIAGHTTAGTGTIYGLSIAGGAFTGSNIISSAALQANSVTFAKLLSTIFSGQVQTYTPTTNAIANCTLSSPSGYYINLGGIKLCWGTVQINATADGCHGSVTMPSTFFSSVQAGSVSIISEGGQPYQTVHGDGFIPATLTFYVKNTAAAATALVSWVGFGV
jgi:hypothetical protein